MNDNLNSTFNINVTSGAILKFFFWSMLFVLGYFLRDLILVILVSIVVASAVEPFVFWLTERRIPRTISVILIYVLVFLTIFILVSLFLPLIFEDFFSLFNTIPSYIKSFDAFNYISDTPAKILNSLKNVFAESFSFDKIMPGIQMFVTGTSGGVVDSARTFFGGIFSFGFIIVFSFYLAVQEKGIDDFLRLITPLKYEKYVIETWVRSKRKIGLWMQGQILLGVLIAVFAFLGLTLLRMNNALSLAVLAGIFELIPVFGPILAAFPAVILAFMQEPKLGFYVIALYLVIQQFENHLIYPLVVRKVVGIPPLISILFLIIGARLAGFWGILLSIPTAVVLIGLAEDYEKKKRFVPETAEK